MSVVSGTGILPIIRLVVAPITLMWCPSARGIAYRSVRRCEVTSWSTRLEEAKCVSFCASMRREFLEGMPVSSRKAGVPDTGLG